MYVVCSKNVGFVLFRHVKTYRHRNDCHEGSSYSQMPRNRRHSVHAGPHGERTGVGHETEEREEHGPAPLLGF